MRKTEKGYLQGNSTLFFISVDGVTLIKASPEHRSNLLSSFVCSPKLFVVESSGLSDMNKLFTVRKIH